MARFFTALLILAVLAGGCVSVNYTKLGENEYQATDPSAVIVYADPSDVPGKFEKIGLLNASGGSNFSNEQSLVDAMKQKAAEMGADGIILGELKDADSLAKVAGAFLGVPVQRHGQAVAIRFLDPFQFMKNQGGTPAGSAVPIYVSLDGTRQVKVFNGQAFLYDLVAADNNPRPTFLSDNVTRVQFLPSPMGIPPQVQVTLNNGTILVFDPKGNPVNHSGN
jgi:hypothetical protein